MKNRILITIFLSQCLIIKAFSQESAFSCFDLFSQKDAQILNNSYSSSATFLGIAEGVDVNYTIHTEMIKHLNIQSGVRNILVERSYGEAYLFNLFLLTGDDKYLQYDPEWSTEMRAAFFEIYNFNKTIPESKRLRFFGFDGIMFITPVILSLKELIPKEKVPNEEIREYIDSLKSIQIPLKSPKKYTNAKNRLRDMEYDIKRLREEIRAKENHYRDFFGINFVHIDQIISNRGTRLKENRNDDMYSNILKLVNDFKMEEGFYAMVGELHVNNKHKKILSWYLKNESDSPFRNKVFCISIHYENCKSSWPGEMASAKVDQNMKEKLLNLTNCSNFIFTPSQTTEYKSISDRSDHLIFVSDKGPIHFLKKQ
jgi:hypothetical protein